MTTTTDTAGKNPPLATLIQNAEDARRLAACWNACDGIPTEVLERYYGDQGGIDAALDEASARDHVQAARQRDRLRAALAACVEGWRKSGDVMGPMISAVVVLAEIQDKTTADRVRADIAQGARQSKGKLPG